MPGKVFISCGQRPEERQVGKQLKLWLQGEGFHPYVAIETQSIQDVTSGIIGNLTSADYYVFIDLPREKVTGEGARGSLFTHQELAIAYYLGFDQVLFLRHSSVLLEGIGKYLMANAKVFDQSAEIICIVRQQISERHWNPYYSRHLLPVSIERVGPFEYRDHTSGSATARNTQQYIWHVTVENRRTDTAAMSTIALLDRIQVPSGLVISPDKANLKWAETSQYERTILPRDCAKLDAFGMVDGVSSHKVYLHSSRDVIPRPPILEHERGKVLLHYKVFAHGFPLLEFPVELNLTDDVEAVTAKLV